MKQLLAIILVTLVLTSCERKNSKLPTSNERITAKPDTINHDKPDDSDAIFNSLNYKILLSRLFDNPDFDTTQAAIWKPNYYERMTLPVSYDGRCHTNIDTIMYFIDQGKRKCACVILTTFNYRKGTFDDGTKIKIGDCHFCGVPVGIALLAETEDKNWELYKFEKAFTSLGYFGTYRTGRQDSGQIGLKQIGDKWTCLSLIQGVGGNGGYLSGSETLYSIEEFHLNGYPNSTLSNLLSYSFFYSNVDAVGIKDHRKEETTAMKIIKKPRNYYNIDLITISNGKSATNHYKYSDDDNQYVKRESTHQ